MPDWCESGDIADCFSPEGYVEPEPLSGFKQCETCGKNAFLCDCDELQAERQSNTKEINALNDERKEVY